MYTKYPRLVGHQQKAIAALRVAAGLVLLTGLLLKANPNYVHFFTKTLKGLAAGNPLGFYAGFLQDWVIPNGEPLLYLLLLAELLAGLGLLLGVTTAPAALLGALIELNYALAHAHGSPEVWGFYGLMTLLLLALAFTYAGTTWGLDRKLMARTPHWLMGLLPYESKRR